LVELGLLDQEGEGKVVRLAFDADPLNRLLETIEPHWTKVSTQQTLAAAVGDWMLLSQLEVGELSVSGIRKVQRPAGAMAPEKCSARGRVKLSDLRSAELGRCPQALLRSLFAVADQEARRVRKCCKTWSSGPRSAAGC